MYVYKRSLWLLIGSGSPPQMAMQYAEANGNGVVCSPEKNPCANTTDLVFAFGINTDAHLQFIISPAHAKNTRDWKNGGRFWCDMNLFRETVYIKNIHAKPLSKPRAPWAIEEHRRFRRRGSPVREAVIILVSRWPCCCARN